MTDELDRLKAAVAERDRLIRKLELKLFWTRRFNQTLRQRCEDLIDEMVNGIDKFDSAEADNEARRKDG